MAEPSPTGWSRPTGMKTSAAMEPTRRAGGPFTTTQRKNGRPWSLTGGQRPRRNRSSLPQQSSSTGSCQSGFKRVDLRGRESTDSPGENQNRRQVAPPFSRKVSRLPGGGSYEARRPRPAREWNRPKRLRPSTPGSGHFFFASSENSTKTDTLFFTDGSDASGNPSITSSWVAPYWRGTACAEPLKGGICPQVTVTVIGV